VKIVPGLSRVGLFFAYAARVVAPYPWNALPKVDRRTSRLIDALRHWTRGRRAGALRIAGAAVLGPRDLAARLADPTAGVVRLRAGTARGYVVAGGDLVRAHAQRVLGGPEELGAPRPLTPAERAVLAVTVAAALDELDAAVEVEVTELGAPAVAAELGEAAVIEVAVERGSVAVVVPVGAVLAPPRRPLGELARPRAWIDALAISAPVVVAAARLDRAALGGLRPRDVVVADRVGGRQACEIRVGRGALRGALVTSEGRVTVHGSYSRAPRMDETLGDDATIEIAVAVGDVRMSVRSLLELQPGHVLELGRPLGSAVELRVGPRVIARGELVDVDGDVGVRVLSIEDGVVPA